MWTPLGLDPADYTLVGFDMSSSDDYIDATDAQFVDITHTDGNYLGIYRPIGTADFYFNGGLHQPGCPLDINDPISNLIQTIDKSYAV